MPAEDFDTNGFVEAGSVETVDQTLVVSFGVIDEIVECEGVSGNVDDWVELRGDLPVAVVVVDVEEADGCVGESFPPLKSYE